MQLLKELQRRNVFRVIIGYIVACWLLLQVADVVLDNIGAPGWVIQTIMLVFALGFPVIVIFSWAYEVTPEGIKRESEVDRSQSITHVTGRKLDRAIIGVLVLAVVYLSFQHYVLSERNAGDELNTAAQDAQSQDENQLSSAGVTAAGPAKSIAVLPFANMSADQSSVYFSDGLADTLLHMLAQVSELRVAARTSSFQFRDQSMDVAQIGEQLNVGAILEGSVQKAGDKIRVTAQLIDAESGYHLWSGNFDRQLDDIFQIQDEIASEVVSALKLSLLGSGEDPPAFKQTDNIEAYTEYLLAINDLESQSTVSLTSAVGHLQEAIRIDPEYAQAYATLGRVYLALEGYGMMSRVEAVASARNAAARALDLSHGSLEALAVLAEAERIDGNREEAGRLIEEALTRGGNDSNALRFYAAFLWDDLRVEEAAATYRKVISLDPLNDESYLSLAALLTRQRRFAEANEVLAKLQNFDPGNPSAAIFVARIEHNKGNLAEAVTLGHKGMALDRADAEGPLYLAHLHLALGMPDEAQQWFDRGIEIDNRHPGLRVARLYLNYYQQQNAEESFRLARELLEDRLENRWNAREFAMRVLVEDAIKTGDMHVALDVLDNLYPELFDDSSNEIDKNFTPAFYVGWALTENGDVDRGRRLLLAVQKSRKKLVEAFDWTVVTAIQTELLLGNHNAAVQMLDGFRQTPYYDLALPMLFEHSPGLDPLRGEPAFEAILDEYHRNAGEQRALLQDQI